MINQYFIFTQLILIPILGSIWIGIKNENKKKERLFRESLRVVRTVSLFRRKNMR